MDGEATGEILLFLFLEWLILHSTYLFNDISQVLLPGLNTDANRKMNLRGVSNSG